MLLFASVDFLHLSLETRIRLEVYYNKAVPKNFVNLTEKHLLWSPFLVNLGLGPVTLLKKEFMSEFFL